MKKVTNWLRLAVISTVCIGFTYGTCISGSIQTKDASSKRPDLIIIDSMAAFDELEKPPVSFFHDAHTLALAKKNQSKSRLICSSCHLTKNDQFFPKFQRLEDTDKKTVMNTYHDNCISCHGEMRLEKEKTGPVDCDDCHTKLNTVTSARAPMGFDKSLHFRHSKASENKCEKCHHAYDENKKTLFYDKGKEGSCRYCHEEQITTQQALENETIGKPISMPMASHMACIDCHIKTETRQETNLPVSCAGCHGEAEQAKIKKAVDIPRLKRNQPDVVLLKADAKPQVEGLPLANRMEFVPFNHKAHETANDTCRTCHHNSLQPCNECHTPSGPLRSALDTPVKKKAVSLEKAMHKTDSDRSCNGCHNKVKQQVNCAGCHGFVSPVRNMKDTECIQCHSIPTKDIKIPLDANHEKELVASALKTNKQMTQTFASEDIPETVKIKQLSNLYEPVAFPHRKVVNAIADRISDNKLSGSFHASEATICQGCHHNSPASKKPPQCSSCHGASWDASQMSKPGILGAYHQQCMGCHKQMKIEKPMGCTECHKLKNN